MTSKKSEIHKRDFVWLFTNLAAFEEHFASAERMLLRFAVHETEHWANNATAQWKQLFQPALSGTCIPFGERLALLRERLFDSDEHVAWLAAEAFGSIWKIRFSYSGLQRVVLGGVGAPPAWQPTKEQFQKCQEDAFQLALERIRSKDDKISKVLLASIVQRSRMFLKRGMLDQLKGLADLDLYTRREAAELLNVTDFLLEREWKEGRGVDTEEFAAYRKRVQEWRDSLVPDDWDERLKVLLSQPSMFADDERVAEVTALAEHFVSDLPALRSHFPWLGACPGRGAQAFGHELGKQEGSEVLIHEVLDLIQEWEYDGFGFGLLWSALERDQTHVPDINTWLDQLPEEQAELGRRVAATSPERLKLFERLCAWTEQGFVSVRHLEFPSWYTSEERSFEEVALRSLRALQKKAKNKDGDSISGMLSILSSCTLSKDPAAFESLLKEQEFREIVADIVPRWNEASHQDRTGYRRLFPLFVGVASEASVQLLIELLGDSHSSSDETLWLMSELSSSTPDELLEKLGEFVDSEPIKAMFAPLHIPLVKIETPKILKWLEAGGIERVRSIVRHLPYPYVDSEAKTSVTPHILAEVLATYGDDQDVARQFKMGSAGISSYSGKLSNALGSNIDQMRPHSRSAHRLVREWATSQIGGLEAWRSQSEIEEEERSIP